MLFNIISQLHVGLCHRVSLLYHFPFKSSLDLLYHLQTQTYPFLKHPMSEKKLNDSSGQIVGEPYLFWVSSFLFITHTYMYMCMSYICTQASRLIQMYSHPQAPPVPLPHTCTLLLNHTSLDNRQYVVIDNGRPDAYLVLFPEPVCA